MLQDNRIKKDINFQITFSPLLLWPILSLVMVFCASMFFLWIWEILFLVIPFYIFLLLWLGFIYISFIFSKNLKFIFTKDEVIFKRDFITFYQKRIKYTDIKEVRLNQGIIQKTLDLGTVTVISQANIQDAGIALFDIKEYQETYDFLIEKTRTDYTSKT